MKIKSVIVSIEPWRWGRYQAYRDEDRLELRVEVLSDLGHHIHNEILDQSDNESRLDMILERAVYLLKSEIAKSNKKEKEA